MRLLILTQKVDKEDVILGFFHRWIEELAKHYEKITVICLERGKYDLPSNVKVLTLGKEKRVSRLNYVFNFYKFIIRKSNDYDSVFVHMNQEYVLLGGLVWKILDKRVFLWRNHPMGTFLTDIAVYLSDKVLYTSQFSYTSKWKDKGVRMSAGIDTELFTPTNKKRRSNTVLSLGRISPIKNIHMMVGAMDLLRKCNIKRVLSIYGSIENEKYYKDIRAKYKELEEEGGVEWHDSMQNQLTPLIYNSYEIFINLTPTGSFDKTILEAMACGTLVITSNKSFSDELPSEFLAAENEPQELALKIKEVSNLDPKYKSEVSKRLRSYVVKEHSLDKLVDNLIKLLKT